MDLLLKDVPEETLGLLLSLVRQDLTKMRRSHPKLAVKAAAHPEWVGTIDRAEARYAFVESVYEALRAARGLR